MEIRSAPVRLAGFVAALVAVLGLGAGLGAAVGPDAATQADDAPAPEGEGVVSTVDGYGFEPVDRSLDPAGGAFRFAITDPEGRPQHEFRQVHDRDLHLSVVDRELTTFHHVHPALTDDGTWSVDLPALAPGSYRAVADFMVADGPRLALGTDLSVAGTYQPVAVPDPADDVTVEGYDIHLATERRRGGEVTASLTVTRDGEPIDLEPYLGADGHLVAMRAGDLAYAHVHPVADGDSTDAGTVVFDATLPSAGRYRLFLDFKHGGVVRTAAFTFDQGVVTGAPEMEH